MGSLAILAPALPFRRVLLVGVIPSRPWDEGVVVCEALGTVDIDLTTVDPLGPTPVRVVKDILPYHTGIAPVTRCGCLQKQTVAGARGWQLSSTVPSTKPYFLA